MWLNFRDEWEKASQALKLALKQYNLKFSVILSDPDMAAFRAMPEFKDLQDEVNGSTSTLWSTKSGYNKEMVSKTIKQLAWHQ